MAYKNRADLILETERVIYPNLNREVTAQGVQDLLDIYNDSLRVPNLYADAVSLRAEKIYFSNAFAIVNGLDKLFKYDSLSAIADDGTTVIKPDDVTGNGRWIYIYDLIKNNASFFDGTVGTPASGAMYETHAEAFTAGARCVKQVSDVTEIADTGINETYEIEGNGYDLTCHYRFSDAKLTLKNLEIYTGDSYIQFLGIFGANKELNLNNIIFNYSSRIAILNVDGGIWDNVKFNLPNVQHNSYIYNVRGNNIEMNGGGSNCGNNGFFNIHSCEWINFILSGEFINSSGTQSSMALRLYDNNVIDRITDTSTNGSFRIYGDNNIIKNGNIKKFVWGLITTGRTIFENMTIVENGSFNTGAYHIESLIVKNSIVTGSLFTNGRLLDKLRVTDSTVSGELFSRSGSLDAIITDSILEDLVIAGDEVKVSQVALTGDLTNNGDFNSFSDVTADYINNSGTSDYAIFSNCLSNLTPLDSSTTTIKFEVTDISAL